MNSTHARLARAFAVGVLALLAAAPAFAHAVSFTNEYPFGAVNAQPQILGVTAFSSVAFDTRSARMTLDGATVKAHVRAGSAAGYWSATEVYNPVTGKWTIKWTWVPGGSDPTKSTIYAYPVYTTPLADGTHTVTASIKVVTGATSTDTWTFSYLTPPVIGTPTPSDGSTVDTTTPAISVPVSDNSPGALSATATVNGSPATATVSGGIAQVTSPELANDATTTVTVTVRDASGAAASKTWGFYVQVYPEMVSTVGFCSDCHPDAATDPDMADDCSLCHAGQLDYPHQGDPADFHARADVSSCSPCHVSQITVEHARRANESGPLTCLTCHDSTAPAVTAAIASGDTGCSACHSGASGHEALHETTVVPACAGSGCHSGSSLTTIHINEGTELSCDSCHDSTDPDVVAAIAGHDKACTSCHGDGHAGSHLIHTNADDPRGPGGLVCGDCHDADAIPLFADGQNLANTTVCDTCHSPGGSYNGVVSTGDSIGAKTVWDEGAYEDTATLQPGKGKWCAGCHDYGISLVQGVQAPPVAGDETSATAYGTGFGFYKTGHGVATSAVLPWTTESGSQLERNGAGIGCEGCHDFAETHTDGDARSYFSAQGSPGSSSKYQSGYRLTSVGGGYPLEVPRKFTFGDPVDVDVADFALCLGCHDSAGFTSNESTRTNFRNENTHNNAHYEHLAIRDIMGPGPVWRSDWTTGTGDSRAQCVQCHNVHGTKQLSMVNGPTTLLSGQPGLRVLYTDTLLGGVPSNVLLPNSIGTNWVADDVGPSKPNSICAMACHGGPTNDWEPYYRVPFDSEGPSTLHAYGRVGSPYVSLRFDEGVFGASGGLQPSDLTLSDLESERTIGLVSQVAGDSFALLTMTSPLDAIDDIGVDAIGPLPGTVRDAAGNPAHVSPRVILSDDSTAPLISDRSPAPSASDVATNASLTFVLADHESGVDFTTFDITLAGSNGYSRHYTSASGAVTTTGTADSYTVTVLPGAHFNLDEVVTATVNVSDVCGNPMPASVWSFGTEGGDHMPPSLSGRSPDPGAADVPRSMNVTMALADAPAGVDWSTFDITLAGSEGYSEHYTDLDTSIVSTVGTPAAMAVTVNPDTDFGYSETITVTVSVSDLMGNAMTPEVWSFTTVSSSGPTTVLLHPSGLATSNSWATVPGSTWATSLDTDDGDGTYANHGTGSGTDAFSVEMDDLGAGAIVSYKVCARVRCMDGSGVNPYTAGTLNFRLGDQTSPPGGTTRYTANLPVSPPNSGYTLLESPVYTTDSSGGSLTPSDIDAIRVFVQRVNVGAHQDRCTEAWIEVTYTP